MTHYHYIKSNHTPLCRRLSAFFMIIEVMLAAAALLSGCDEKDLCYHHEHLVTLRLDFDWRDAPEADPQGMVVFFYPEDEEDGHIYRFNFSGIQGGEISVAPGSYHLITYNNDTEFAAGFNTDSFHGHYLFTREGSLLEPMSLTRSARNNDLPRPSGTESEPVVVSPDELWGCTAIDVEVTELGLSYKCFPLEEKNDWIGLPPIVTEHVITLYPHDLLCRYSYEVRNVKGLRYVINMCGALTGMAPSLLIHDESLGTQCVTIPVEAHKDMENNCIKGEFLTFGHHEENNAPHHFALYLVLNDGLNLYVGDRPEFNVTEQIHSAPDRRRVHFIIDGLEIDGKDTGGNSWSSSVDDWGNIYEDIIMGKPRETPL